MVVLSVTFICFAKFSYIQIHLTKKNDIAIIRMVSGRDSCTNDKRKEWRVMSRMVLSILVDNTPGVLSRVTGLFSRRGYNIDSITGCITENPAFSRLTVAVTGDDRILGQISNQLSKLVDVRSITKLTDDDSVCRELVLVKVSTENRKRREVIEIADIFRAKIVDVSTDSVMIELTGNQSKVKAFIKLLEDFKILELVRTGTCGLSRGLSDEGEDLVHMYQNA